MTCAAGDAQVARVPGSPAADSVLWKPSSEPSTAVFIISILASSLVGASCTVLHADSCSVACRSKWSIKTKHAERADQ